MFSRLFRPRNLSAMAPVAVVSHSVGPASASAPLDQPKVNEDKSHHKKGGGFVNPWESFKDLGMSPTVLWQMRQDWVSRPVPPPEDLPPILTPTFTPPTSLTPTEAAAWKNDLKTTWLGHACFLVEFPAAEGQERGLRVLLDPVWSHRCSPSQWIGPARIQPPPIPLASIPEVDAVVISHNHYDHMDVATLKHLYTSRSQGSVHFFAPLGNKKWFKSVIGCKDDEVSEMDWWEERWLTVQDGGEKSRQQEGGEAGKAGLRVRCTPCQHFTGRSLTDRNDTLWSSWAIESSTGGKVWFGGDTGYRSVARGTTLEEEDKLPVCPAFEEIGKREGGFDLAMIPIGAYSPRWFMSRIHCSPEDSVELHRHVKSKKSLGMHMGMWVLTDEPMDEPPKRLRAACEKYGISEEEFGVSGLGETVRIKVDSKA